METNSEIKPKSVGKILWEALELWKDHLFPLFIVAIVIAVLLILGNTALVYYLGTEVTPEEADAIVVRQEMILSSLFVILILVITALLDGIIWSYFSCASIKDVFKDNSRELLQRIARIIKIDVVFIGGIIAVLMTMMWLLTLSNIQDLQGLQFFGSMFFLILVAGLLLFVFTPYRFIIRPLFAMHELSMMETIKKGFALFFKGSIKAIGLMLLLYLIIFIFTPPTNIIWLQHLSFVVLGPYAAMVVWVFYRQLPLPER